MYLNIKKGVKNRAHHANDRLLENSWLIKHKKWFISNVNDAALATNQNVCVSLCVCIYALCAQYICYRLFFFLFRGEEKIDQMSHIFDYFYTNWFALTSLKKFWIFKYFFEYFYKNQYYHFGISYNILETNYKPAYLVTTSSKVPYNCFLFMQSG